MIQMLFDICMRSKTERVTLVSHEVSQLIFATTVAVKYDEKTKFLEHMTKSFYCFAIADVDRMTSAVVHRNVCWGLFENYSIGRR